MYSSRPRKREQRAAALCLLAVFGLVAAPVLHAQQHAREAEAEQELTRLVERLSQHGVDFDDVFAEAWQLAHEKHPAHSHGPQSQHGSGTLEHFALALHAAPPPPAAPAPQPQPKLLAEAKPESAQSQCRRTPVSSQGPPLYS
jgi:hypothetical protein